MYLSSERVTEVKKSRGINKNDKSESENRLILRCKNMSFYSQIYTLHCLKYYFQYIPTIRVLTIVLFQPYSFKDLF